MNYSHKKFNQDTGVELIKKWGDNIQSFISVEHIDYDLKVAEFIAKHYLENSLILPTVSAITRVGLTDIHNYFCDFLARKPTLILSDNDINNIHVTLSQTEVGVMCGYYGFLINNNVVNARYCMQFQYLAKAQNTTIKIQNRDFSMLQQEGWYILMKHSSFCPVNT
jgi:hypothetical protein